MRHDSVIIKTNAYGLTLLLDPDIPFDQLLQETGEKFAQAARFFRNAQMALTFKGRTLTQEEELLLVEEITANARIHIVCIVDEDKDHAAGFQEAVSRTLAQQIGGNARIYTESLVNGQVLESEQSVLLFGDVKPGAKVISTGHVIILGTCMGEVTAGAGGDERCIVAAMVLRPNTLRIAGITAKSAITKRVDTGEYAADPKLAFLQGGHLTMEPLKESAFSHYRDCLLTER